jgi:hypothetical protein
MIAPHRGGKSEQDVLPLSLGMGADLVANWISGHLDPEGTWLRPIELITGLLQA